MEYVIREFDPKSASESLWESYLSLEEKKYHEEYPEDPTPSKEETRKTILLPSPRYTNIYWITCLKDMEEVIGSARLMIYEKKHPTYDLNKHMAFLHIVVMKEFRREGIATSLLRKILIWLKQENKTIVQGGSQLESGKLFCISLHGEKAITEEESRLSIENVNWEMLWEWKKEGKQRAKGVTLEHFKNVPEDDIENFCQLFTETLNLIPKGELEWEAKETPEIRRATENRLAKLKTVRTTFVSREKDGILSGLTETFVFNDRPTLLYQGLTGVKKQYQGKGLGKWLKAEMLLHCKKAFPDVKYAATDFALVNKPMIAINRKLGFKQYKTWIDYKFQIETLAKTLSQKSNKGT
ncbi:MAG: GNAT family N-acetyltransferase [Candidatus Hodarchaeales archaeon]|jgi:RimJ/RimL family protein N-acetyltransferase